MNDSEITYTSIIDNLRNWLLKQGTFGEYLLDIIDKESEDIVLLQHEKKNINVQISTDSNIYLEDESVLLNVLKVYIETIEDFLVHLPKCWDETEQNLHQHNDKADIKFIIPSSNTIDDKKEKSLTFNLTKADKISIFPKNLESIEQSFQEIETIIKREKNYG